MKKKCLITGILGQDGSYLAEFLLDKGYEVWGMYRRYSHKPWNNIETFKKHPNFYLICGDLLDGQSLHRVITRVQPNEIYNLAAQSEVGTSFDQPYLTWETNFYGVDRLIREMIEHVPNAKFYQASTSELFAGDPKTVPQNEDTPFEPQSPYGKSKLATHNLIRDLRKDGFFCVAGILFNHEGKRRSDYFVTKKIATCVRAIMNGILKYFELGNVDNKRDWGYAPDYVQAIYLMLQQEKPVDYIIATGKIHSIREFVEEAFRVYGKEIEWQGKGMDEKGYVDGEMRVRISPEFFRPKEVKTLCGDASKAKKELGWEPKVRFKELVRLMVEDKQ